MVSLREDFYELVRDIKEPEANREKGKLDEISDEEIILGQKGSSKEFWPLFWSLLFESLNKCFDRAGKCKWEQERIE